MVVVGCKILHFINNEYQEAFGYKSLWHTNTVVSHRVYELSIFKRGQYYSRSVWIGKIACHWLLSKLEQTMLDRNSRHFFMFKEGDIVYMF